MGGRRGDGGLRGWRIEGMEARKELLPEPSRISIQHLLSDRVDGKLQGTRG